MSLMIKRPSRKLITSSLRSDLPMCVNTYDYAASNPTDPGEPLPSAVNITVNAPAKLAYASLGTSGFTASTNSYGVNSLAPFVPFSVSNPVRMQFVGTGKIAQGTPGSPAGTEWYILESMRVTRSSNSASTVFDSSLADIVSAAGGSDNGLKKKLITNGYYLRSNVTYLFAVYGAFGTPSGDKATQVLCFVYSPIKFLPQKFAMRGLYFPVEPKSDVVLDGNRVGATVLGFVQEQFFEFTCSTSPSLIDTDNIIEENFSCYNKLAPQGSLNSSGLAVVFGVTSLSFTL